ncbi:MAG TPA: LysR family transcriptional regulator, partial [Chthonomonadales bacterium]|nr:LysR family transcriptional regulator [Chthonomonadales bacterium]
MTRAIHSSKVSSLWLGTPSAAIERNIMRASGINRAFMQARSLSARPEIAASSAAGMPSGPEGDAQPASGARAMALPASTPARIVAENGARSICKENVAIDIALSWVEQVVAEYRQFHKFIILTMMLLLSHDSAIGWEQVLALLQEDAVLDDLHALVEFAQAGSIAGAADRLFRTPSAITRQLQRLEAELGAELLDRSTKPPRLNSLGSRVLERARDMLQRTEALKSLASPDAEPHGLLRIGLAHALAEGTLIEPIRALTEKYPKVRPLLLSERAIELFKRLLAGELDVAAVPLPEGRTAPPPLLT